ncbi:hypothetical protein BT93_E1240 [Corymbia citriodora subsp. variegata]|nr:hypothetical protein BT93_E1240 [Corymbia citriodora subsp. variegata]
MEKHPSYAQAMKHMQLQTCTCKCTCTQTLPHSHLCTDLCSLNNELLVI